MDNLEIFELSKNSEFHKRIAASVAKAANSISGEDPTSVGGVSSNWANKRHNLATKVIFDSQGYTKIFALQAAAQSGLNTVIEIVETDGSLLYTGSNDIDNDIDYVIASLWDDVAGVSYGDKNS